jgi:hypothetical protein
MIRTSLVLIALLSLGTPGLAQDVVGTSVLGGKRVELLSDNTWRFAEVPEADGACEPINNVLSFCGTIFDWRPSRTSGTDFIRVFNHSDQIAAGIIYEELGAADGMDLAFMRNVVIETAADATGMRPEDVVISNVEEHTVSGLPAETISYEVVMNGLDLRYHNTIVSTENHTFQLVSWNVGKEEPEEFAEVADSFVEAVRITLPEAAE